MPKKTTIITYIKNKSITTKLIVSFVIVSLLTGISGALGINLAITTNQQYSEALISASFKQSNIGNFNTSLNKGGSLVKDIIYMTDTSQVGISGVELNKIAAEETKALQNLKRACTNPKEIEQIAIIEKNFPLYTAKRDQVVTLGVSNQKEEAMRIFRSEARPLLDKCMNAAQSIATMNIDMGNQIANDLSARAKNSLIVILLINVSMLAISVCIGFYLARVLSRPLKLCSARLQKLAEGDLYSPVPEATTKDEVGVMLTSLARTTHTIQQMIGDIDRVLSEMAKGNLAVTSKTKFVGDFTKIQKSITMILGSFNSTLAQITQASDEVASGSEQVSAGAQSLSQGATEQASSIEELAATVSGILEQVESNASHAKEANILVENTGKEVEKSNEKMQQMMEAMNNISEQSKQIGKIIKTIEDIAFQTNILALNAAVEAARAGTAGKGFAVVADEVRNLANRSTEASKSTAGLIENSLKAIQKGTKIADEAAKSLNAVVVGAKEVTEIVDKISVASGEQASSIGQVTQGIDQISNVVQTNSATAEESAAASEELSGQAQTLKNLVNKFKLKNGEQSTEDSTEELIEELVHGEECEEVREKINKEALKKVSKEIIKKVKNQGKAFKTLINKLKLKKTRPSVEAIEQNEMDEPMEELGEWEELEETVEETVEETEEGLSLEELTVEEQFLKEEEKEELISADKY